MVVCVASLLVLLLSLSPAVTATVALLVMLANTSALNVKRISLVALLFKVLPLRPVIVRVQVMVAEPAIGPAGHTQPCAAVAPAAEI